MGIRFICDHCDRHLNVKANQAGMVGDCPFCRNSIRVPTESTDSQADLASSESETIDTEFHVDKQLNQAGLNSNIKLEPKSALEQFSIPYTPANGGNGAETASRNSAVQDPANTFLLAKPQPPSTLGKVDPIAEAPRLIWYFRSKKHGEKGPLKAKVMQEHLDNGDVTIGCIVWREDWEDWQPAERVFPALVALAQQNRANEMLTDPEYEIPDELNPHSTLQKRRRQKQILGIVAIAAGLLTIGLLVLLLIKLLSA